MTATKDSIMYIAPRVSLKSVVLDGIKLIMNGEEAKEFKNKYQNAKVTILRKGRSLRADQLPGPVTHINPSEYNHA